MFTFPCIADDVNEQERMNLRDDIHKMSEVVQVRYLNWMRKMAIEEVSGIDQTLNELGDNVLPASLKSPRCCNGAT